MDYGVHPFKAIGRLSGQTRSRFKKEKKDNGPLERGKAKYIDQDSVFKSLAGKGSRGSCRQNLGISPADVFQVPSQCELARIP